MISMVNVLSYGIYTVDKINSVCVNLEKKKKSHETDTKGTGLNQGWTKGDLMEMSSFSQTLGLLGMKYALHWN